MCSGSTASRPPPQATPTPGRQATWATTGNCQPRQGKPLGQGGQRTGSPRHTHRPSRLPTARCRETPTDHTTGTPRKQQPPDHPNRVDTDSANRDTRRKPRGTSPRFESTQKHRRQCNPVTRPLLARDLGVYPAPPRAARGGGYPLLSPSPPYCAEADQPRGRGTTKTLPLWLHAPGQPRPNPLTPSHQSRCTPPTPTTRPNGVTPAPRAGVTPTNPYMVTARNDGGQRGSL